MKLRRMIAILMITLANVFILAHGVVPHYHHDGIVCFEAGNEDCKACDHAGSSSSCCQNEEKHHTHLEDCNLQQVVERTGNSINEDFSSSDVHIQYLVCICTLGCYDLLALEDVVVGKHKQYVKYVNTYTSPYVGSFFGLRAPPFTLYA